MSPRPYDQENTAQRETRLQQHSTEVLRFRQNTTQENPRDPSLVFQAELAHAGVRHEPGISFQFSEESYQIPPLTKQDRQRFLRDLQMLLNYCGGNMLIDTFNDGERHAWEEKVMAKYFGDRQGRLPEDISKKTASTFQKDYEEFYRTNQLAKGNIFAVSLALGDLKSKLPSSSQYSEAQRRLTDALDFYSENINAYRNLELKDKLAFIEQLEKHLWDVLSAFSV